jgi:aryl-alcohol dehydrogenase-like predicted oxidoreductase
MKYGQLGRSGMNVSKICLGTMHFGPKATEEESHAILDKALRSGPLGGNHRHLVCRPAGRA